MIKELWNKIPFNMLFRPIEYLFFVSCALMPKTNQNQQKCQTWKNIL